MSHIFLGSLLLYLAALCRATLWRRSLEDYPDAVCNDGTEAVYYHSWDEEDVTDIVIFLQGGGYCHTIELCELRCDILGSNLCTTRDSLTKGHNGILSDDPDINPIFHSYYKVELHYCSSDLYIGNRTAEPGSGNYHFRGRTIVRALIDSLEENVQISRANNVILTGSSAGGAGTVFWCNQLQDLLPDVSVRCIPDAAFYYPNISLFTSGCEGPNGMVRTGSALWHGGQENFDVHSWLGAIRPPLFIGSAMYELFGMGLYCTDLLNDTHIALWGQGALAQNRKLVSEYPNIGLFAPSCFAHSMINDNDWYNAVSSGTANITYAQTIGNWMRRDGPIHIWDECPDLPDCNSQCISSSIDEIWSPFVNSVK